MEYTGPPLVFCCPGFPFCCHLRFALITSIDLALDRLPPFGVLLPLKAYWLYSTAGDLPCISCLNLIALALDVLLPLLVSCFHLVLLGFPAASLPHPLGHAASYLVLIFYLGYHSAASSRYLQLVQFASFCPTHTSSLWLHHAKLRQVCFLGPVIVFTMYCQKNCIRSGDFVNYE